MFTNAKSELAKLLTAFYGTPYIKPSSLTMVLNPYTCMLDDTEDLCKSTMGC